MPRLPAWISAITAIVAIVITLLTYLGRRQQKRLDYQSISILRLLNPRGVSRVADKLKLSYGDTPVKDPCIAVVRLINAGRVPIETEDFQQPVRIDLGCPVVSADVARAHPPGLETELADKVTWKGTEAQLLPTVFNPRDWLALLIVTDGVPEQATVIIRVKGGVSRQFNPNKIWLSRIYADIETIGSAVAVLSTLSAFILGILLTSTVLEWLFPKSMENFRAYPAESPKSPDWVAYPLLGVPFIIATMVWFGVKKSFELWDRKRSDSFNVDLDSV
jgi:hypothetical protein